MTKTVIFLVRHATPDWTRTDIPYEIPPGPPLTEIGKAEARQAGEYLRRAGVTQIYASPLERARHTAELAGQIANAPVQVVDIIQEWQRGESEEDVAARMWAFWQTLLDRSRNSTGPVALVSHGGPIRLQLEKLGLDGLEMERLRDRFDHRNPLPPAGVWKVQETDEGGWSLRLDFIPVAASTPADGVEEAQDAPAA
jgi:broad specificity phosphatase PhoE